MKKVLAKYQRCGIMAIALDKKKKDSLYDYPSGSRYMLCEKYLDFLNTDQKLQGGLVCLGLGFIGSSVVHILRNVGKAFKLSRFLLKTIDDLNDFLGVIINVIFQLGLGHIVDWIGVTGILYHAFLFL